MLSSELIINKIQKEEYLFTMRLKPVQGHADCYLEKLEAKLV